MEESKAAAPLLEAPKAKPRDGSTCCGCLAPSDGTYEELTSAEQMKAVQAVRALGSKDFDATDPEVDALLAKLRGALFPGRDEDAPLDWRDAGFQRNEPRSDVRGAGIFGLRVVVRIAEEFPYFREAFTESQEHYPFAASALNVVRMVQCHLRLTATPPSFCPCCGAKIRDWKVSPTVLYGVMGLIEYDTSGMFMIIVATLVLLDAAYHKRARSDKSFTILQFNEVLIAAREGMLKLLALEPEHPTELIRSACALAGVKYDNVMRRG